jgi:epsin
MYDVKSYYNQAKNMVLNLTEMEAKVRDATNDEPWYVFPCRVVGPGQRAHSRGASSTLMQEIADG